MEYERLDPTTTTISKKEPPHTTPLQKTPARTPDQQVLHLQHTIGNRAVGRLLQAKLQVSQPDDVYEREADHVAKRVVTMPDHQTQPLARRQPMSEEEKKKEQQVQMKPLADNITPLVHRQMIEEEEKKEDKPLQKRAEATPAFQRQAMPEEEKKEEQPLQTKSTLQRHAGEERADAGADIEHQLGQSRGKGNPLPDSVRSYMEPRFGADFSGVRVHTGGEASMLNRSLGAQAFTHGSDIYFGAGSGPTNLDLTAHELTHVVQQAGSDRIRVDSNNEGHDVGGLVQRKCAYGGTPGMSGECEECGKKKLGLQAKLRIGESGDVYEQDADRIADQVIAESAHAPVSGAPPRIQRFTGQPTGQMDAAPTSVDQALASPGRPLEPELKQDMEQRFGHDFSRVRVHSGATAEQSAHDVNAHAYTVGQDVVFGAGRFAPGTKEGGLLIAHELTHVVQQAGDEGICPDRDGEKQTPSLAGEDTCSGHFRSGERESKFLEVMSSPASSPRIARVRELQPASANCAVATLLQRQSTSHVPPPGAPAPPSAASIDVLWTDLHGFVDHGNSVLARVDADIREYVTRYDGAYEAVVRRLSESQKREAEREKWKTALEVVAAVGIGLAGGELLEAGGLLHEAVNELVKKATEIVIVETISPAESKVDFGLPPDLNNDKVARGYVDQLAQAWKGMAVTEQAVLQFDTRVRNAERAKAPTGERPSVAEPLRSEDMNRLRQALTAAERALALFLGTVDTPVLKRTQQGIERDLWIRWMSKSEANAADAQMDKDIAPHLLEIGVYYDMEGGTEGFRESKLQVERLNQLGRVGVVALPPFWPPNQSHPLRGAVHVRADAYQAAGRRQPPQTGAPPYVAIEWQEGSNLRTGDVVILEDTSPDRPPGHGHHDTYRAGGLLPKRLGPFLRVDATERAAALAFLGADAASYPRLENTGVGERTDITMSPDRARPFVYDVHVAVESLHAQPPLVVRESEEGVLVSEADGTNLVLFTVYTSWGEAKETQLRMGVRRVVAVDLNPNTPLEDFADKDIVVTRHANFYAHISAVRALIGRGPKITVQ